MLQHVWHNYAIGLIYNDVGKWGKQFHNTSDDGRYDLVISTLKAPLTESFIEELDFGGGWQTLSV